MSRIVSWFSCGAASAVATKLAIQAANGREVVVAYCDTSKREHPDNMRFLKDCELWFGQEVLILGNDEYERDPDVVFRKTRFLVGSRLTASPCSRSSTWPCPPTSSIRKIEMADVRTMTLNLSDPEMRVLDELAERQDLSKTAVMRQALRLYQLIDARLRAGETMSFSGDRERIALFIGPGFGISPEGEANG